MGNKSSTLLKIFILRGRDNFNYLQLLSLDGFLILMNFLTNTTSALWYLLRICCFDYMLYMLWRYIVILERIEMFCFSWE